MVSAVLLFICTLFQIVVVWNSGSIKNFYEDPSDSKKVTSDYQLLLCCSYGRLHPLLMLLFITVSFAFYSTFIETYIRFVFQELKKSNQADGSNSSKLVADAGVTKSAMKETATAEEAQELISLNTANRALEDEN